SPRFVSRPVRPEAGAVTELFADACVALECGDSFAALASRGAGPPGQAAQASRGAGLSPDESEILRAVW
ncbi:MAG: hypothetical protein MUQ65_02345, partial [Armatimonadetes bacterium]|nr:hypothetical protein [Armatimonadota bacterium]